MNNLKIVKIIDINEKKKKMLLLDTNNDYRIFNVSRMFKKDISQGMQFTWKCMLDSNEFINAYLVNGDIVWPGRCEILHSELEQYTEVI